ncbi:MAG: hypothetical protein D6719_01405 [Candidatus Dadabacteria bacterium]|nr:MAG: hypothetical protein D6719_01405 [Candidatus Dadabacteria bacterium]
MVINTCALVLVTPNGFDLHDYQKIPGRILRSEAGCMFEAEGGFIRFPIPDQWQDKIEQVPLDQRSFLSDCEYFLPVSEEAAAKVLFRDKASSFIYTVKDGDRRKKGTAFQ